MERRGSEAGLQSARSSSAAVDDTAKDGNHLGGVPEQGPNVSVSTIQSQVDTAVDDSDRVVEEILQSDIGIITLLNRLKQSIASCKDFASFIKKRAGLEEEHAAGLRKLCRSASEAIARPDSRKGTYAKQFEETTRIHQQLADNGLQFSEQLHRMYEDLNDMAGAMDRGRKYWKTAGMNSEKRVQETELLLEKAKAKYDSIAEEYERARSRDHRGKPSFSLRTGKHGAAHEEELQRRLQAADAEYRNRVDAANTQRTDLLQTHRPHAVKELKGMILECDAGLTYQLQKFATLNERLLLNNGLSVSPIKSGQAGVQEPQSMRDVVFLIDNEKDFKNFVLAHRNKVPRINKTQLIPYERHPSLAPGGGGGVGGGVVGGPGQPQGAAQKGTLNEQQMREQVALAQQQQYAQMQAAAAAQGGTPYATVPPPSQQQQQRDNSPGRTSSPDHPSTTTTTKPTFGISLAELSERDGSAVPIIVNQCIQAVDLFGMDVEGIYRLSGSEVHKKRLKIMFDQHPEDIDFRRQEAFFGDVESVAAVLKQFFRELPDPLFTNDLYTNFIDAAKIDDEAQRRDMLHGLINSLPDPNYATLRALILHLNRIQDRQSRNRMSASNLAIPFGPTLLGSNSSPNVVDAPWQCRVVETVLSNCFSIFEPDVGV